MIKTTHQVIYGGASKAGSNDPCKPDCGSDFAGGLCKTFNSILCTFTGSQQAISDATISGDKIAKMLPMAFVLIIIGIAVGLSKGRMNVSLAGTTK